MELGEKVVGTKAGHNALAKGTPLKKEISFSMGDVPCEILPATLRPSRGKSAQVWAFFTDGSEGRIGYCKEHLAEGPVKAALLVLDYTKVGNYSKSYRILTIGRYDPEEVKQICKDKMEGRRKKNG